MSVKCTFAVVLLTMATTSALAQQQAKTATFFRDGGWSGEVKALRWGKRDSPGAWAVGRHSKATAGEACSGREGPDRPRCVRDLRAQPELRIFADCSTGVTWQAGKKTRFSLTDAAKAGQLRPLEDDAAWTIQLSHRAKWTVVSWLGFLCPASSKAWRLQDAG